MTVIHLQKLSACQPQRWQDLCGAATSNPSTIVTIWRVGIGGCECLVGYACVCTCVEECKDKKERNRPMNMCARRVCANVYV